MNLKQLAMLSLGTVTVGVAACAPTGADGDLITTSLLSADVNRAVDLLGEPDLVQDAIDGNQIMAWIDAVSAAALVVEVDADDQVVDVSYTPTWVQTDDASALELMRHPENENQ